MKREREHDDDDSNTTAVATAAVDHSTTSPATSAGNVEAGSHAAGSASASTTNFRNVSACNRCRNRKNRCDQRLPKCSGCEKAGVKCVGFDPVSKREIPRSYVYYLETRVNNLEDILRANGVPCPPPSDDFSISEAIKPGVNVPFPAQDDEIPAGPSSSKGVSQQQRDDAAALDPALHQRDEKLNKLVNNIGVGSASSMSDSRLQPSNSGIPFSRVVFAAVKSSVPHGPSGSGAAPSKQLPSSTASGGGGSSSFFALHTKPSVKPAQFPEKTIGLRLVELYFEHANPQIPILHRPEFMALFERVYATDPAKRTPRELYLVNMVFAIGAGIINDSSNADVSMADNGSDGPDAPNRKRLRMAHQQNTPEEYHSSAIVHLDSFLGSTPTAEGVGGGMEELQAVLLLAGLALLRPVAPGLWYIIGVAVRLAIDLGLYFEDVDHELDGHVFTITDNPNSKATGRRQWTRDLRRRLWWCTFSFDRLVSTCVGRPVGIIDQVITTSFPSILDDKDITPAGFLKAQQDVEMPTYKLVSRHYFRLRLLQSEILQVLQYRQAEQTRVDHTVGTINRNREESFVRTDIPSPFLHGFHSFRDWRADVDRRLWEWKESAPKQFETGVAFTPLFLELNYWQAVIMLYRQSLAVPEPLAGEMSPSTGEDVQSPSTKNLEAKEDEQMVFMKVAQAGQTVLKIYRKLHRLKLVNYTFLATHHLFMSGISFLYAIWHSTLVRSQLTLDDVDFTVLIATSVLGDMVEKCPPAEACRDAFVRMSKATITMCMNTTGFGNASTLGTQPLNNPAGYFAGRQRSNTNGEMDSPTQGPGRRMRMPKFDMNLKDLFSDEEIANRHHMHSGIHHQQQQQTHSPVPPSPSYNNMISNSPHSTSASNAPGQPYDASNQSPSLNFHNPSQQYTPFQRPGALHLPTQQQTNHQMDFTFADLDFLDTFNPNPNQQNHSHTQNHTSTSPNAATSPSNPANSANPSTDPNNPAFWSTLNGPFGTELDLGFGTGGTGGGFDAGGHENWGETSGGGVDLFDGFFFGNSGGAGGY